jgi:hypothetical protein
MMSHESAIARVMSKIAEKLVLALDVPRSTEGKLHAIFYQRSDRSKSSAGDPIL